MLLALYEQSRQVLQVNVHDFDLVQSERAQLSHGHAALIAVVEFMRIIGIEYVDGKLERTELRARRHDLMRESGNRINSHVRKRHATFETEVTCAEGTTARTVNTTPIESQHACSSDSNVPATCDELQHESSDHERLGISSPPGLGTVDALEEAFKAILPL